MVDKHSFNVNNACRYGLLEAILINHLEYWIEQNEANNRNFHDGRYWTFNSAKAFSKIFPYVSERKIRLALKHLQDENIIMTGNFNKSSYDRTLWYAFTDYATSILQNRQMEVPEMSNQNDESDTPIPDNNPVVNTGEKTHNNISAKPKRNCAEYPELFERFWKAYPKKVAKGTAAKAFKKAKVDESLLQDILKALEWQRETKQWKAEGGQYIPNPATYINGRRWEDEQEEQTNGTNDISGTCEYKLDVLRL